MLIIIRGHIRNSFDTLNLYNLIKSISMIDNDLKIFIHTWNIQSNNLSWRVVEQNNTQITEEMIHNYFGDVAKLIKHIIIDDDQKIQLIGNINGNINNGPMPIRGWKNYLYGKYMISDYIYNKTDINRNETVINMRFDLMNNSNIFPYDLIMQFIQSNMKKQFTKNIFLYDKEHYGIDNIYIGNIDTIYQLNRYFYYFLDEILSKNADTIHQEFLIYRVNNILYDPPAS